VDRVPSTRINPGQPAGRRGLARGELRLYRPPRQCRERPPVSRSISQEQGVFRSLATRRDPVTGAGTVDVAWVIDAVRAVGLVVVLITVCLASPGPATAGARGTAIAVTLGLSAAGWLAWLVAGHRNWITYIGLAVMSAAGGVLAALSPNSPAIVVGCMAAFSAGARLSTPGSLIAVLRTLVAFLVAGEVVNDPIAILLGYSFAFVGLWTVGLTRREYSARAEQAERMLAETRRTRQAETAAVALAERARIARDIHDVLAHSLAAVSVNLQAAEGLLTSGTLPADNPELAKAVECVGRAGNLTREGLAAARRAVLALRDDTAPLPDRLSSLADEYRAIGDLAVDLAVTGVERALPEQASLAAYRTAQEALTNARKHAPGQPVTLRLGFEPAEVTVTVVNPLPLVPARGPLATAGAGYGLAGLRERAALVGCTLEAGPVGDDWRVYLRIPI
jgi:signal transduction histidine kinase